MPSSPDFLVLGAGIFGLATAIELRKRHYRVELWNPDTIPHPRAASTDISKIVRMEYGSDELYFRLGADSIRGWKDWNETLGEQVYRETGLLLLMQEEIGAARQKFEAESYRLCQKYGWETELLSASEIRRRFPAINTEVFGRAHFNPVGGYVRSGRAIALLAAQARALGVVVKEGLTATGFQLRKNRVEVVESREGESSSCGTVVVAAGAHTPYLVPDLQSQMRITGHPVFHISPQPRANFLPEKLPVFTADISNTGWYGFPLHPEQGVVKLARHTNGVVLHPETDDRRVVDAEVATFRIFLEKLFPLAASAPLVYTRRCLYTDTLDGHFWIDYHPEIKGLAVASGGSGHGMKMGPVLGELVADMLERKENRDLERFRWRDLRAGTRQQEQARFVEGGHLD